MDVGEGYSNRNFKPHGDFVGGRNADCIISEDYQSTLDSLRSIAIFESDLQKIRDELEESKYDVNIDFAYMFGSSLYGVSIFPDALINSQEYNTQHLPSSSDLDGAILLDYNVPESREYALIEEVRDIRDQVTESGDFKRDYWVWERNGFENSLGQAGMGWTSGKKAEFFVVPEDKRSDELEEVQNEFPKFGRTVWAGFYVPDEYAGEFRQNLDDVDLESMEFWKDASLAEMFAGLQEFVEDDQGMLRSDFEYDLDLRNYFEEKFNGEHTRTDAFEENIELSKAMRNLKKTSYQFEDYIEGSSIEREELIIDIMGENLSDQELVDLVDGKVGRMRTKDRDEVRPEHDISEWVDVNTTDNTEFIRKNVQNILLSEEKVKRARNSEDSKFRLGSLELDSCFEMQANISLEEHLLENYATERLKEIYDDIQDVSRPLHEYKLSELVALKHDQTGHKSLPRPQQTSNLV